MTSIIYKDSQLTITKEFLYMPKGERETIQIDQISQINVMRKEIQNYKAGAILFFIVGAITIIWGIGVFFLVMGVAAWLTKVYIYRLVVTIQGVPVLILENKSGRHVKSIANTIHGVAFSKNILSSAL